MKFITEHLSPLLDNHLEFLNRLNAKLNKIDKNQENESDWLYLTRNLQFQCLNYLNRFSHKLDAISRNLKKLDINDKTIILNEIKNGIDSILTNIDKAYISNNKSDALLEIEKAKTSIESSIILTKFLKHQENNLHLQIIEKIMPAYKFMLMLSKLNFNGEIKDIPDEIKKHKSKHISSHLLNVLIDFLSYDVNHKFNKSDIFDLFVNYDDACKYLNKISRTDFIIKIEEFEKVFGLDMSMLSDYQDDLILTEAQRDTLVIVTNINGNTIIVPRPQYISEVYDKSEDIFIAFCDRVNLFNQSADLISQEVKDKLNTIYSLFMLQWYYYSPNKHHFHELDNNYHIIDCSIHINKNEPIAIVREYPNSQNSFTNQSKLDFLTKNIDIVKQHLHSDNLSEFIDKLPKLLSLKEEEFIKESVKHINDFTLRELNWGCYSYKDTDYNKDLLYFFNHEKSNSIETKFEDKNKVNENSIISKSLTI